MIFQSLVGVVLAFPLIIGIPFNTSFTEIPVEAIEAPTKQVELEEKDYITLEDVKQPEPVKEVVEKPEPKKEEVKPEPVVINVTATAYTAYCEGCSGVTYTGQDLRANPHLKVIAVDPNVIPLGSRVHVEGYGEAIAGDIGGAIKGHKIDVFIPNEDDAWDWGVKKVKVTILD